MRHKAQAQGGGIAILFIILVVLGGGFYYYNNYYPKYPVTEIHVFVGQYTATRSYFIDNLWIRDTKLSRKDLKNREEISGLYTFKLEIQDKSGKRIFNESFGLTKLIGEHVILWDSPQTGTFDLEISLKEGTKRIVYKRIEINYQEGG